jgi:hypothetical protein
LKGPNPWLWRTETVQISIDVGEGIEDPETGTILEQVIQVNAPLKGVICPQT